MSTARAFRLRVAFLFQYYHGYANNKLMSFKKGLQCGDFMHGFLMDT